MKKVLLGVVAVLAFTSCARTPPNEKALATLGPQVQQIRASATAGDRPGAQQQLDQLKASVEDFKTKGELTPDKASQILAAADEVNRNIPLIKPPKRIPSPRPTTPKPSPTPTPAPTPPPTTEPSQQPSPTIPPTIEPTVQPT